MQRADQLEIFRNNRTTFGGAALFPFQPVGKEITVPFFICTKFSFLLHVATRQYTHGQKTLTFGGNFFPAFCR